MSSEVAASSSDGVGKRYLLGQGRGARGVLLDLLGRRDARQDLWAVRDLACSCERGESLGLVGRNGAGKTTTLRLLAGHHPADARAREDARAGRVVAECRRRASIPS